MTTPESTFNSHPSTKGFNQSSHHDGMASPSSGALTEKHDIENGVTSPPLTSKDMKEPPDGGAAAWLVVFGAWCTSFCSFGWINSLYILDIHDPLILKDDDP